MSDESALRSVLARLGRCVVAFSGGVDSSYLAAVAAEVLGKGAVALTIDTPYIQRGEIEGAGSLARLIGIRHYVVALPTPEGVAANPTDRCYLCKRALFGAIVAEAARLGIEGPGRILDGSNAEDDEADRPGMRALRELGVASPLRELGFRKEEIRRLSLSRGLPTWNKPPLTCLLTRFPHGTSPDAERLGRVERAEELLHALGLHLVRVRDHGSLARIETSPDERRLFCDTGFMDQAAASLRALGYARVALDLEGYRGGGMAEEGKDV